MLLFFVLFPVVKAFFGEWKTGHITFGSYSSDPLNATAEEAISQCDDQVTCAGVSLQYFPDEHVEVRSHSFLPPVSNTTNKSFDMYVFQMYKSFTFHPGRFLVKEEDVLKLNSEIEQWTLSEVMKACERHAECIAFSYEVYSGDLVAFDDVQFFKAIETFEYSDEDTWRSYVSNTPTKAEMVNSSALLYDEESAVAPYVACCSREGPLPTLEQVKAVDGLERISCDISPEEFYEKYEKKRKPVMLVGCDKNWPAKERWTYPKLINRFANDSIWRAQVDETGELNENATWSQFVDALHNSTSRAYVFDQLDHELGKTLEEDYTTPPQFRNDLYGHLDNFPTDYGSLRWFCIGKKGTGTMPHIDPSSTDAWNALLEGHKWWVIWPDSVTDENALACHPECSVDNPLPQHWYASAGMNVGKTEYSQGKRAIHALQRPGETIYVPYNLVHSVFNMDNTIAVTANFGSRANINEVWHAIIDDENEQHWRRMYYQVFTKEQRKAIQEGPYWTPVTPVEEENDGDEEEEEDDEEEEEEEEEEE